VFFVKLRAHARAASKVVKGVVKKRASLRVGPGRGAGAEAHNERRRRSRSLCDGRRETARSLRTLRLGAPFFAPGGEKSVWQGSWTIAR
jgi:hypothetical protein